MPNVSSFEARTQPTSVMPDAMIFIWIYLPAVGYVCLEETKLHSIKSDFVCLLLRSITLSEDLSRSREIVKESFVLYGFDKRYNPIMRNLTQFSWVVFVVLFLSKIVFSQEMIQIPSGPFLMGGGEDGAAQEQIILKAYAIDQFEVTQADFKKVFPEFEYAPGKDRHPVSQITWHEALRYCKVLKKRLPSGAEWEKAARGTEGNIYPWGNKKLRIRAHPSYSGMVKRIVGFNRKDVSIYGVREMASSVWEWTMDRGGEIQAQKKIVRGGLWNEHLDYEYSKTYEKMEIQPELAFIFIGFRCAR